MNLAQTSTPSAVLCGAYAHVGGHGFHPMPTPAPGGLDSASFEQHSGSESGRTAEFFMFVTQARKPFGVEFSVILSFADQLL